MDAIVTASSPSGTPNHQMMQVRQGLANGKRDLVQVQFLRKQNLGQFDDRSLRRTRG